MSGNEDEVAFPDIAERVNDDVIRIVETGELRRAGENNLGDLWRGELKGDAPGDTEEKTT